MIFTFLKQSYSRRNKKWADFGCILKTEPTGATHALNLVIKKGNQGYFQKFWLNNLKNKISIKRDRKYSMVNSLSQESSRMDGRKKKEREDSRDMWKES